MSRYLLQAFDLSKRHDDGTLALDALNLKIGPGEIHCILGAKGAGKTTAIHLFLGFTRPTAGRALIDGINPAHRPAEARERLAYLMAGAAFYEGLTALENLEFFARLSGCAHLDRKGLASALREVGLPERVFGERVGRLAAGQRQKLGLASALVKDAPTLLLDEPLAGLDPQETTDLLDVISGFRERGKAILLATQELFHAKRVADRVGILKEGRLVLSVERKDLRYQDLDALYVDDLRQGVDLESTDSLSPLSSSPRSRRSLRP